MNKRNNSNDLFLASIGADQTERDNNGAVESNYGHGSIQKGEGQKLKQPAPSAAGQNTEPQLVAAHRPVRVVLRARQAQKKTGLRNTMFYRIQNPDDPLYDSEFAVSFSICGGRARGYFEDEIDAWLERQAAKDPRRRRLMQKARDTVAAGSGVPPKEEPMSEKNTNAGARAPGKIQKCKAGGAQ